MDFGSHLESNLLWNSTQNKKSTSSKRFQKNIWKIHFLRSKIDAPKIEKPSKNIGGLLKITLLAYSQRDQKRDRETSRFGEVFAPKNRPKIEKKRFRNQCKNHVEFWSNVLSILAPFWTPPAAQKFKIFHDCLFLMPLLGHLGAKSAPKWLQDGSRIRFFFNLVQLWHQFSKNFFLWFSTNSQYTFLLYFTSLCVFNFPRYLINAVSICSSNSQFLARWRFDARSALDIRRPREAVDGRV